MAHTNAQKIFKAANAEAVLTEQPDLRKYLTGIETSFGYVLTTEKETVFYTDSRYLEAVKAALKGSEITVKQFVGPLEIILSGLKEVAIPLSQTYYPQYERLKKAGLEIKDSAKAFQSAMIIKQDYELEFIKQACKIADDAFTALLSRIKEGMSENDLAAELEYLMRKNGASGTSFSTIAAFGKNSSVPHHETGADKLKFGDVILLDFGCKYGGYCSDCTRTFLFGDDKKHENFKRTYKEVLAAHMLVKEKTTCGMTGAQSDAIARDYLKECGLDKFFTHSLGHGIGINVHELPYISPKGEDILQNGMVFSDEPGVYFVGDYGIRIEDTVALINGKTESLTNTDKNLLIL